MHISCALNRYIDKMVNVNNGIFSATIHEPYHIFVLFFLFICMMVVLQLSLRSDLIMNVFICHAE